MQQGTLPFHYAQENDFTGMTTFSGLPAYLELASVAGLGESARRHVGVKEGTQGWTDAQMVIALAMLNLADGESVDDLRLLEKEEGLCRALLVGRELVRNPPQVAQAVASISSAPTDRP